MQRGSLDPVTKPRPARGFVVFKWAVYTILALDVLLYARFGRGTELLDTASWVVLVALFEWETGGWPLPARGRPVLHALRGLAAIGVLVAVAGYALERQWLDFANETAWLGVVALLELDLRLPARLLALHRLRRIAAAVLYLALIGFLATWLVSGLVGNDPHAAWLDAWDALWWLVAFWVIELNVFGWAPPRGSRAQTRRDRG